MINHEILLEDIVKGHGENLDALSALYNCPNYVLSDFSNMIRNSFLNNENVYFESIYSYRNTKTLLDTIQINISKNKILSESCQNLS